MSQNPTSAVLLRATAAKGLRGRAPGDPEPTPELIEAPVPAAPAATATLEPPTTTPAPAAVVTAPEAEPEVKATTPRKQRRITGSKPAEEGRGLERKNLMGAIDADLHHQWMSRLEASGVRWRGDAMAASVRTLFAKTEKQTVSAVLAEASRPRNGTAQIAGRVDAKLYDDWYQRLDDLGRLPRGAALGAALRAALELTDNEFQQVVLEERKRPV